LKHAAADASAWLFNWSGSLPVPESVLALPKLRGASRSVGLERTLFPELMESPVPLYEWERRIQRIVGRVYAGRNLVFRERLSPMIRSQQAGVWEAFDVMPVSGQTIGIIGYGGHRPRNRCTGAADGDESSCGQAECFVVDWRRPHVEQIYRPEQRIEMIFALRLCNRSSPVNFGNARHDR